MIKEQKRNWGIHLPETVIQRSRRHPLGKLLHICAYGYYDAAEQHRCERPEPFWEHILIYCSAGRGYYVLDGQRQRVRPGEFFVIPADKAHAYGNDPDASWTILWIHYAGSQSQLITERLQEMPRKLPILSNKVESLFAEMQEAVAAGWNDANIQLTNFTLWHFLGLFTAASCVGLPLVQAKGKSVSERIIEQFQDDLAKAYTLGRMARSVGLSESHFSAQFKSETGSSPMDYLIRLRILEAAQLLVSGNLRIKEISQQVGYNDAKFFSKSFKKIMGMGPREYRKRHSGRA